MARVRLLAVDIVLDGVARIVLHQFRHGGKIDLMVLHLRKGWRMDDEPQTRTVLQPIVKRTE